MNFNKIYALGLRHLYLIMNSFPRVLDLIYWPTVQIFLWGFISKFFTLNSEYYSNTVGVILTAAILYDFLFLLLKTFVASFFTLPLGKLRFLPNARFVSRYPKT